MALTLSGLAGAEVPRMNRQRAYQNILFNLELKQFYVKAQMYCREGHKGSSKMDLFSLAGQSSDFILFVST